MRKAQVFSSISLYKNRKKLIFIFIRFSKQTCLIYEEIEHFCGRKKILTPEIIKLYYHRTPNREQKGSINFYTVII